MKPTRPIARIRRSRWGLAVLWVGLWVTLAAAFLAGCSPQRNYRVLSFFFDGVPDPNAPKRAEGEENPTQISNRSAAGPQVVTYVHKPYLENKCDSCHAGADQSNFESFQKVGSNACLKCHTNKLTQYPVMHGPVVAVECLLCHAPHESLIPGMLKAPPPQVCTQCHDRDLLSPNPPEHTQPNSQCLACHVGHGGPKHKMLRVDASGEKRKPVTMPSASPDAQPTAPNLPHVPAPPVPVGGARS